LIFIMLKKTYGDSYAIDAWPIMRGEDM
jgi:hypothetical protein